LPPPPVDEADDEAAAPTADEASMQGGPLELIVEGDVQSNSPKPDTVHFPLNRRSVLAQN
jgi:hypothetical protein